MDSDRRPYLDSGVYPKRLRVTREDVPRHILAKLAQGLRDWEQRSETGAANGVRQKNLDEIATYYERELSAFRNH